jgi:predicted Zn-dependent protease
LYNHPRYAVEVLERLDPEAGWMPSWTPYWRRLTEAYHMLGDHRRECEAAQRGRRQHPESTAAVSYEARAYAAMGDVDATRRIADESVTLGPDPFATVGDVWFTAARELRTHGNVAAGTSMLERAIEWQRDECSGARQSFSTHVVFARMLYDAAEWTDAFATLSALQRQRPDDVEIAGYLGAIAARQGDVAAAHSAVSALRAKTGRFHFGKHLAWCARISAVLGDEPAAQSFLRGAFARGYSYDIDLHTDVDLALLSNHDWYQQLLRPKG